MRNPELEIATAYSDRRVDLVGEGFDAAVRLGTLADSSLIARRIASMHAVTVASPAYLARAGTPADAGRARLARDDPARRDSPGNSTKGGKQAAPCAREGRFSADSGAAELAGVVAGLGIAVMPAFLAAPAIETGEIVSLLDDYAIPPAGMYVVRPPPAEPVPMKVRALIDIMLEKFGRDDWDACRRTA